MQTVEMHPEDVLAATGVIPEDQPIVMLNLLRYRVQADYGDRTGIAPCSGREAYHTRYVPAFGQVAAEYEIISGIQVIWVGTVLARMVGPADEQWDEIALVEYPSFAAFQRITGSPQYQADAAFHRLAALADWRLIATTKMS